MWTSGFGVPWRVIRCADISICCRRTERGGVHAHYNGGRGIGDRQQHEHTDIDYTLSGTYASAAPPEKSHVRFLNGIDEPAPLPAPPTEFMERVGARVQVAGGWEGVVVPTSVNCKTVGAPPVQSGEGWGYTGKEEGVLESLKVSLLAEYEAPKPRSIRPPYSPSVLIGWVDETGIAWSAHTSWSMGRTGPTVVVSPDRRSVRFTGYALATPLIGGSGDLDRTTWITFDGALTCAEPMRDLN
ncbi:hypothetical protein SIM91_04990 [Rhodococcus opacus]|uniref:hypothetical protein n=1 Tax=Rhodococcus opacus TaxID=37919 RepID=UPI0002A28F80|nr:hypothetical protein [Rhodococcus opacus]ELB88165.1 hypothetical protein Rwratislav_36059 [Rhodococcus wratislaviensis IFP 2016]MDX5962679.1 hypothetical protein [Rhodococcus opacus]CAG7636364.1 hypothetical protein E143388_07788 [Rhodococcus opacus]